jgi:hypothetical protein
MSTIKIETALMQIKQSKLNQFRCYLTGAPYATIDDDEIRIALRSIINGDDKIELGRIIDEWELRSLTFSTQLLPSLRGMNQHALKAYLMAGHAGSSRIVTYMMTRLLYPSLEQDKFTNEQRRSRARFSRELYDLCVGQTDDIIAALVQELAAIDSYCAMPLWHTLWAFHSSLSKYGIHEAPANVQRAFNDPESLLVDFESIRSVIIWLFKLMLHITERDGVAGKSGSKMAQEILMLDAEKRNVTHIPEHQKKGLDIARQRIRDERDVNSRKELRIAHSATHGKGSLPNLGNDKGGDLDFAARLVKLQLAKQREKTEKVKEPKPRAEKPKTSLQISIAAAFESLNFNGLKKD